MEQYLAYGSEKQWVYVQNAPSPVLIVANSKEEALDLIADKIYDLFKEAVELVNDEIDLDNPGQEDVQAALGILTGTDFTTGETSEDANILINEESGCIIYDDNGFMDDNSMDAATTLILGLAKLSVKSYPDSTTTRTETVIKMSLENDILPRLMKRLAG